MSDSGEFNLLTEFCQKCLCDERMTHDQYSYMICSFSPESVDKGIETLKEIGMEGAYRNWKSQLQRDKQEIEYQIGMMQDLINESEVNLKEANREMGPIQEDYDKKKSDYDAVANGRYKLYPDNPRL